MSEINCGESQPSTSAVAATSKVRQLASQTEGKQLDSRENLQSQKRAGRAQSARNGKRRPRKGKRDGGDGNDGETKQKYWSTANPDNTVNIDLHRTRYREKAQTAEEAKRRREEEEAYFKELYSRTDWRKSGHMHHTEMPFSKFFMDLDAQRAIYKAQVHLVDKLYERFGKTEGSWERYTLMFRNGWSPGDKRKPITEEFQQYCEEIYCPIMWTILFGRKGWEQDIRKHWSTFKSCTIKVCAYGESFYGENIFHMHIDGKIGLLERKNYSQRHMNRLLFSIVTDALDDPENLGAKKYGTTDYPIWQPRRGFRSNHQFHKYMQTWYRECGLENSGLPRPHYAIPEELIYRARTGEVLLHFTHSDEKSGNGPQAIHSEPNPCPDRHLFVFDFNNLIHKDGPTGKYLPSTEIPEDKIIGHMRALEDSRSEPFRSRMMEVVEFSNSLLTKASKYPGAREAIEQLVADLGVAASAGASRTASE